jgi:hypothetical protein
VYVHMHVCVCVCVLQATLPVTRPMSSRVLQRLPRRMAICALLQTNFKRLHVSAAQVRMSDGIMLTCRGNDGA